MSRTSKTVAASLILLGVVACASAPDARDNYRYGSNTEFGRVTDIERVAVGRGGASSTGAGAAIGGIAGGVLGHQAGSGRGNDAATATGAVGGAVVGNKIEKNNNANREIYRISVRIDGGASRVYEQDSPDGLGIGDSIRIANGRITRR